MAKGRKKADKGAMNGPGKRWSVQSERLRLSVYRSLNNIYAQVINDTEGNTLTSASSLDSPVKDLKQHKGNCRTAKEVGTLVAQRAIEKGIKKVVFDRSGYLYHGRIKAWLKAHGKPVWNFND